jgi:transposase
MSLEVNRSNQNKQKQPKYTIEFKQDAAKLVNEKDYTHRQAADNLGISLKCYWTMGESRARSNNSIGDKEKGFEPD